MRWSNSTPHNDNICSKEDYSAFFSRHQETRFVHGFAGSAVPCVLQDVWVLEFLWLLFEKQKKVLASCSLLSFLFLEPRGKLTVVRNLVYVYDRRHTRLTTKTTGRTVSPFIRFCTEKHQEMHTRLSKEGFKCIQGHTYEALMDRIMTGEA